MRGDRSGRPGRLFAVAFLCVASAAGAQEAASTVSAEEAADFARRAALSALHGPQKIFLESIDADGILRRILSPEVWGGLTGRQQDILRATVRDHFADAFSSDAAGRGSSCGSR